MKGKKPGRKVEASTLGDEAAQALIRATQAALLAHSPYSRIRVGACLVTGEGSFHLGANVENASLGLSICAERAAVAAAVSAGQRDFKLLAVASPDLGEVYPCGACLQVLVEFCDSLEIVLGTSSPQVVLVDLRELLPGAFEI